MKKIVAKYSSLCFVFAFLILAMASCKEEKLSEAIIDENGQNVSLSVESRVMIADSGNFTLDNNKLTVPVTINFNGPTSKAFTVQTSANTDTVATLIGNGTLPATSVALETGEYTLPPVVNIEYGVKSVTFDLIISRTFLERQYGKEVVLAVKMSGPSKGNTIDAAKNTSIIIIDTDAAIASDAVHYIEFESAGQPVMIPDGDNYTLGSQDINIPFELNLTGVAEPQFTVDVVSNTDTVNKMINSGVLQNAIALNDGFSVSSPKLRFEAGRNDATLTLTAKVPSIVAISGKKAVIALTLQNPTKHQVSQSKKTVIVVIDPDFFRPFNRGAPFVISGVVGQTTTINAAYYDLGGEGIAFHDNGGRDGGDFRRPDNVDVGGNDPNYFVGWTGDNEWLTYSVIVDEDGEYEFNAFIGSNNDRGRYSLFFGDENLTGILANKKTNSYGDFQPNTYTVNLKKGKYVMKFYMNVGAYDVKEYRFTRKN